MEIKEVNNKTPKVVELEALLFLPGCMFGNNQTNEDQNFGMHECVTKVY